MMRSPHVSNKTEIAWLYSPDPKLLHHKSPRLKLSYGTSIRTCQIIRIDTRTADCPNLLLQMPIYRQTNNHRGPPTSRMHRLLISNKTSWSKYWRLHLTPSTKTFALYVSQTRKKLCSTLVVTSASAWTAASASKPKPAT